MTSSAEIARPLADPRLDAARKLRDSALPTRQRDALGRWIALAERGDVTKGDLRPDLFGRTLQYVALVEVLEDGSDFRHRVEGREVVRRFGNSGTERFSALYTPAHFRRLQALYLPILLGRRPSLRHFMAPSIEGEELSFSQLVLPSVNARGQVAFCAVVYDFPDPLHALPSTPLAITAPWRRLRKGSTRETMLGDRYWR